MSPDRPLTDRLRQAARPMTTLDLPAPRSIHDHVMRPIVERLNEANAHRVLEMGCGDGWFTGALDRCGFEAMGADRDAPRLAVARRQFPHLRFEQLDAMQPIAPGRLPRFHAVVAIDLIDHLPSPRKFIASALQMLEPAGLLVLTLPYYGYAKNVALALTGRFDRRWDPLLEDGRMKFFSRATLTGLLSEFDLVDLRFETIGRIPPLARAMMISATTRP
jgi:2-polyprenyl-6-hydroxyphenyl methylase/3-demethylubiquinone-9 3-methyltransferase